LALLAHSLAEEHASLGCFWLASARLWLCSTWFEESLGSKIVQWVTYSALGDDLSDTEKCCGGTSVSVSCVEESWAIRGYGT